MQGKNKSCQNGYTLIEMLVVLSIFMLLIGITVTMLPKHKEKREMEAFLRQFSKDYYFAQSYAIDRQITISFLLDYEHHQYFAQIDTNERLFTKSMPAYIKERDTTLGRRLYFNAVGHVSKSGTWLFIGKQYKYMFTVMLGKGRHYYREY